MIGCPNQGGGDVVAYELGCSGGFSIEDLGGAVWVDSLESRTDDLVFLDDKEKISRDCFFLCSFSVTIQCKLTSLI